MGKSFVIDRRRWLRLTEDGKFSKEESMLASKKVNASCCLGFALHACGFTYKDMREGGFGEPETITPLIKSKSALTMKLKNPIFSAMIEVDSYYEASSNEYGLLNTSLSHGLMIINDDKRTTDEYKEAEIIRQFAQKGITVTFIN